MTLARRTILSLVAALCLGGCHMATQPTSPETFYLESIDGRPLPTSTSTSPTANDLTILWESLLLDGNGTATSQTMVQGASPSQPIQSTIRRTYTLVDGVLTLGNMICGPAELCTAGTPMQGQIAGDVLTLSYLPTPGYPPPTFTYRRAIPID
jgi:hypothetical protein